MRACPAAPGTWGLLLATHWGSAGKPSSAVLSGPTAARFYSPCFSITPHHHSAPTPVITFSPLVPGKPMSPGAPGRPLKETRNKARGQLLYGRFLSTARNEIGENNSQRVRGRRGPPCHRCHLFLPWHRPSPAWKKRHQPRRAGALPGTAAPRVHPPHPATPPLGCLYPHCDSLSSGLAHVRKELKYRFKPVGLETLTRMCCWPSELCAGGGFKTVAVRKEMWLVFQNTNCWTAQLKDVLSQTVTKKIQSPELTGLCEPVNNAVAAWKQWVTFQLLTYFRSLDSWRTLRERQWCIWIPEFKKQIPKFPSQTNSCSNYELTMAKYFFSRQVAVDLVVQCQIRRMRNWKEDSVWGASAPRALLKQVTASSGGQHLGTTAGLETLPRL